MDPFSLIGFGATFAFIIQAIRKGGFDKMFERLDDSDDPSFGPPPRKASASKPAIFYHGTKREVAIEIYETGLWMIGQSEPRGVYLGKTINVAKGYIGNDGRIVVVSVAQEVKLQLKYEDAFYYPLPGGKPAEKYYRIPGLIPIGVIAPDGTRIR